MFFTFFFCWFCLLQGYLFAKCHTPYVLVVYYLWMGGYYYELMLKLLSSKEKTLETMEYLWCNTIFLNIICCDWTCDCVSLLVKVNHMFLCLDSNIFPYWLNLIRSSLTTWSNYFPSEDLSELNLITYSLLIIIFDSLDSDALSFTSTWKMVKDSPKHILENIIG